MRESRDAAAGAAEWRKKDHETRRREEKRVDGVTRGNSSPVLTVNSDWLVSSPLLDVTETRYVDPGVRSSTVT